MDGVELITFCMENWIAGWVIRLLHKIDGPTSLDIFICNIKGDDEVFALRLLCWFERKQGRMIVLSTGFKWNGKGKFEGVGKGFGVGVVDEAVEWLLMD